MAERTEKCQKCGRQFPSLALVDGKCYACRGPHEVTEDPDYDEVEDFDPPKNL